MKNSAAITKEGNTYLKTRSSVGVLGTAQRILLYVRIESRMVLKKRHLYTVSLFLESIIVACGLRVDLSRSGSLPLLYSDYLYLANRVGRCLQSQYQVNGLVVSGDKGGKTSIDSALLSTFLASASRRAIQIYQSSIVKIPASTSKLWFILGQDEKRLRKEHEQWLS